MIYNNLLYFLIAVFVFSTNTPLEVAHFSHSMTILLFGVSFLSFGLITKRLFTTKANATVSYFQVEQKLSILAVLYFVFFVYGLNLKYYLLTIPFLKALPIIGNLAGLAVFFVLLSQIWLKARPHYEQLFQRAYTPINFVLLNIKINLPILLPWLILSFIFDLLALLPIPEIKSFIDSFLGNIVLLSVFFFILTLLFPPLVKRLWGCKPMPDGPVLDRIQTFCKTQNFQVEILFWPLFEGQVLTAAIMGIVPGLRYLLITPSLLNVLEENELYSVLAHEIGHVKKGHLLLYLTLFFSLSVLIGSLALPFHYFILSNDLYYWVLSWSSIAPETLLNTIEAVTVLVFILLYFRFVFGFFIRNFERQADAFVFRPLGTAFPLIRSFEKIAQISGTKLNKKNWHHFGLGERIHFLYQCEHDRSMIKRHDHKLYRSLFVFFLIIACSVIWSRHLYPEQRIKNCEIRYTKAFLLQKIRLEPKSSIWPIILGNYMFDNKREHEAIAAYEKALDIQPANAEANNNLAWLLLTAEDPSQRDPKKALALARIALYGREKGYILDTMATALWANGQVRKAIRNEFRAIQIDPFHKDYYRKQLDTFQNTSWTEDYPQKSVDFLQKEYIKDKNHEKASDIGNQ